MLGIAYRGNHVDELPVRGDNPNRDDNPPGFRLYLTL